MAATFPPASPSVGARRGSGPRSPPRFGPRSSTATRRVSFSVSRPSCDTGRPPLAMERFSVRRSDDGRITRVRYVLPRLMRPASLARGLPDRLGETHGAGGRGVSA
jgi:hypothetical protein